MKQELEKLLIYFKEGQNLTDVCVRQDIDLTKMTEAESGEIIKLAELDQSSRVLLGIAGMQSVSYGGIVFFDKLFGYEEDDIDNLQQRAVFRITHRKQSKRRDVVPCLKRVFGQ